MYCNIDITDDGAGLKASVRGIEMLTQVNISEPSDDPAFPKRLLAAAKAAFSRSRNGGLHALRHAGDGIGLMIAVHHLEIVLPLDELRSLEPSLFVALRKSSRDARVLSKDTRQMLMRLCDALETGRRAPSRIVVMLLLETSRAQGNG